MKQVALLIGNEDYTNYPKLKNPKKDIAEVENMLIRLMYDVKKVENASYDEMIDEIDAFTVNVEPGDKVIIYYAGHGYAIEDISYLLPIDALREVQVIDNTDSSIYSEYAKWINLNDIMDRLKKNDVGINLFIIDACRKMLKVKDYSKRDKPSQKGVFIAYSTSPTAGALDGDCEGSPYIKALKKYLFSKGISIEELFKKVRQEVIKITNGKQIPWEASSLVGDKISLVEENILSIVVDKKRIEGMVNSYKNFMGEIRNKGIFNQIIDNSITPSNIINYIPKARDIEEISSIFKGIKNKLGIIHMLINDKEINTLDIYEGYIRIETVGNAIINMDNDDLYNIDECLNYIERFKIREDRYGYEAEIGKKIILVPYHSTLIPNNLDLRHTKYCMVYTEKQPSTLDKYVKKHMEALGLSKQEEKNFKDIIYRCIEGKKNILLIGAYDTKKDEFISALSNLFDDDEKILLLTDLRQIPLNKGVKDENSKTIVRQKDKNFDKYVLETVAVTNSNRKIIYLDDIASLSEHIFPRISPHIKKNTGYIVANNTKIENNLTNSLELLNRLYKGYRLTDLDDVFENIDIVIVFGRYVYVGGYVQEIWEKEQDRMEKIFRFNIDWELIDKINTINS